jgi:Zn-dependent oligopeptidase
VSRDTQIVQAHAPRHCIDNQAKVAVYSRSLHTSRATRQSSANVFLVGVQEGIKSTGYGFWDRVRNGSFTAPPNPLLDDCDRILEVSSDHASLAASSKQHYPNFGDIQPRHFVPAAEEIVKRTQQDIKSFVEAILGEGQTADAIPDTIKGNPLEDVVLQNLYRINFAAIYLERLMMWYMMLQNENKTEMSRIFNSVQQTLAGAEVVTADTVPLIWAARESVFRRLENTEKMAQQDKAVLEEKARALSLMLKGCMAVPDEDEESAIDHENISAVSKRLNEVSYELSRALSPREGSKPNPKLVLPLLYEILSLRKQKAQAAGFDTYADFYLSWFMTAPNVEAVADLHKRISSKAILIAEKHKEAWQNEDRLSLKDIDKMALSGSELDVSEYRPTIWGSLALHLEMNAVLVGLFDLCSKLFGVVVTELKADDKPPVWNSDVRVYQVLEEACGNLIGTIYFDPFKRPQSKAQGENFCVPLVSRGKLSSLSSTPSSEDKAQSSVTKPIVCIGCDISPPDWESSPVFMAFDEVTNLFHEFGHAMHHVLSNTDSGQVSGVAGVEADGVEFPSQVSILTYMLM